MRIGYFDCFSGAAGDMILGSLIGAGLNETHLRSELAKLHLSGFELRIANIQKQGFAAVKVDVEVTEKPSHRHLHHITKIIDGSALTDSIKDRAKRIFTRLAEAEATVHGTSVEKVHFHEVGAVDAIVDIVGTSIGIEALGLSRIVSSPIPVGGGTIQCDHGLMPVPAPATAELLIGVPIAACEEWAELTTPTGAAILSTLCERFGSMPAMNIEKCGYAAGTREGKTRPNVLRLFVGTAADSTAESDEVVVLETNLDDATGEQIGNAMEALFAAGALDVYSTAIQMKKNRPGVLVSVLSPHERVAACEEALFVHTGTFGIRKAVATRVKLGRESKTVKTRFGDVRMKIGSHQGHRVVASPEYDDCAAAAKKHGVSLQEVMTEARRVFAGP